MPEARCPCSSSNMWKLVISMLNWDILSQPIAVANSTELTYSTPDFRNEYEMEWIVLSFLSPFDTHVHLYFIDGHRWLTTDPYSWECSMVLGQQPIELVFEKPQKWKPHTWDRLMWDLCIFLHYMDVPTSQPLYVLLLCIFYAEVWSFDFNCDFMCAKIRQVASLWSAGAVWLNGRTDGDTWQSIFYDDVFFQAFSTFYSSFYSFVFSFFFFCFSQFYGRSLGSHPISIHIGISATAPWRYIPTYNQKLVVRSVFGHLFIPSERINCILIYI